MDVDALVVPDGTEVEMREPCRYCGGDRGRLFYRNGQHTVRCVQCRRHCYNAPKHELGLRPRTVASLRDIVAPQERALILMRANGRCELCGAAITAETMHVGHLLSLRDCDRYAVPKTLANDIENKSAMCEECNLGLNRLSVTARWLVSICLRRAREAVS